MTAALLAAGAAVAAGAALQSAVGFGFALVAAPLVFAATSPEEAVGLMVLLGVEVNLLTLLGERRRPRPLWGDVGPVVAWALPGALAGVAVLRALDALALQLLVSAGVVVTLVVNRIASARAPCNPTRRGGRGRPPAWPPGRSTPPPPRAARRSCSCSWAAASRPARVRDTLIATFLGLAVVSTTALAITGTERDPARVVAGAARAPVRGRPARRAARSSAASRTAASTRACSPWCSWSRSRRGS